MNRYPEEKGLAVLNATSYIYWALAGCMLGFGLLAAFSIGWPFFLLGTFLVLYRVKRTGERGLWVSLIGMGVVPALFLLTNYFFADHSTTLFPDTYFRGVLVFMIPTAIGVVWGLVANNRAKGYL
jgi:hypothetical protein